MVLSFQQHAPDVTCLPGTHDGWKVRLLKSSSSESWGRDINEFGRKQEMEVMEYVSNILS